MKVKIFQFWNDIIEDAAQQDINTWLEQNPGIDIKFITQSESQNSQDCGLTVSLWYI